MKEVSVHTCSVCSVILNIDLSSVSPRSVLPNWNVVSVIDEQDGKPYYYSQRFHQEDPVLRRVTALAWLIHAR